MNSRAVKGGVAAALVVIAAYWYWSPLLAIRQMQLAAKAGDADAFSDHVDYPRLRESFKGQFSAMLTEKMAAQSSNDDSAAKVGAALGMMLGTAMVNQFVDAMVRPEVVIMRAMQEGKLMPKKSADGGSSTPTDSGSPAPQKVEWSAEHKGVDKYIAYAHRPGEAEDRRIALVLERSGFATWKLTEIRLPPLQ
jgi:hypothetical protein